jgi:hypothetical protein
MSLVTDTINRPPSLNAPSSSSNPLQKLTKKQKKGLAFRERKSGKQKKTADPTHQDQYEYGLAEMDFNAIPAMEDEVLVGVAGGSVQVEGVLGAAKGKVGKEKGGKGDKSKGKRASKDAEEAVGVVAQVGKGKKRKREEGDIEGGEAEVEGAGGAGDGEKGRKRKKAVKKVDGEGDGEEDRGKQRFILFVGMSLVILLYSSCRSQSFQAISNIPLPKKPFNAISQHAILHQKSVFSPPNLNQAFLQSIKRKAAPSSNFHLNPASNKPSSYTNPCSTTG